MRPNAVRRTQRGISMIAFLFVAAVCMAVAMIGFRVLPAYVEFYSVQRAMQETLNTMRDVTSVHEFRRAMDARLNVNYVDAIKAADIQLAKQGNVMTATVSWDRKLHMVANAFILLEFEAVATR